MPRYEIIPEFGEFLMKKGLVTQGQLAEASARAASWTAQHGTWISIGYCLVELGFTSQADIQEAIGPALRRPIDAIDLNLTANTPSFREKVAGDHDAYTTTQVLEAILTTAIGAYASEMRIVALPSMPTIEYRVDGEWYEMQKLGIEFARAIVSIIRSLLYREDPLSEASGIGQMFFRLDDKEVDIRVRIIAEDQGSRVQMKLEYR